MSRKTKKNMYTMESSMRNAAIKICAEQLGLPSDATASDIKKILSCKILALDPKIYFVYAIIHYLDPGTDDIWDPSKEKPHAHIWVKITGSSKKVRTILHSLGIKFRKGLDDRLFREHGVESIENDASCAMYATHETTEALNDPNKVTYPVADIITNDLDRYLALRAEYIPKITDADIKKILNNVAMHGMSIREAMKAIGGEKINPKLMNELKVKRQYYLEVVNPPATKRQIKVYWHCGASNSGKTFFCKVLIPAQYGQDNVYNLDDRSNNGVGGWDNYDAEPVIVIDEFRSDMQFSNFLTLAQGYPHEVHGRGTGGNKDIRAEVIHITSKFLPGELYEKMLARDRSVDGAIESADQMFRRITATIIHRAFLNGEYVERPADLPKEIRDQLDYGTIVVEGAVKNTQEMNEFLSYYSDNTKPCIDVTRKMINDRQAEIEAKSKMIEQQRADAVIEAQIDAHIEAQVRSFELAIDEAAGDIDLTRYGYKEPEDVSIPSCMDGSKGFRCNNDCSPCRFPHNKVKSDKSTLPDALRYRD